MPFSTAVFIKSARRRLLPTPCLISALSTSVRLSPDDVQGNPRKTFVCLIDKFAVSLVFRIIHAPVVIKFNRHSPALQHSVPRNTIHLGRVRVPLVGSPQRICLACSGICLFRAYASEPANTSVTFLCVILPRVPYHFVGHRVLMQYAPHRHVVVRHQLHALADNRLA